MLEGNEMASVICGIILYKNSELEIKRCLDSIKRQSAIGSISKVILRDHAAGYNEMHIKNWINQNSEIFQIDYLVGENIGFGAGHNAIFFGEDTNAYAYFCINPDGFLHPQCLEVLLSSAEKEKWQGLFEAVQEPIMHPKSFSPATGVTDWSSAACLLIPSAIFRELSGFHDDFFLYCEDVDLSWRAKALGYACYICVHAKFFHYAVDRQSRSVEIWRSACILSRKWRADTFFSHAINVLSSLTSVSTSELRESFMPYSQFSLESVLRAQPNFHNSLTFSQPMWKD